MKKGADDFKKKWENKDKDARKDNVPLIEEIDTSSMEDAKTKNKTKKNDLISKGKEMMSE